MYIFRAVIVASVLLGGLLGPSSALYITAPAAIISLGMVFWEVTRVLPKISRTLIFVVLFFGLLSFQQLISTPSLDYGHQKFLTFWTLTVLSAAIASLIRLPEGFVPFAVIWIAISLYLTAATILTSDGVRAAAFGANPIWVARALAAGIVLLVWLYWTKRLHVVWTVVIGIALLGGIFATGSRGPLLAAIAGITVIVLTSRASLVKKVLMAVISTLGASALVRLPLFQESRIVGILSGDIADTSTRQRMWDESLPVIAENPLGVGYGNWVNYTNVGGPHLYPHNLFLEVFVEHGVFIGVLFILLVSLLFIRCLKLSRHSEVALAVVAWFAAEIVNVSVSGDLNAPIFFFVLALAFHLVAESHSSNKIKKEDRKTKSLRGRTH